VLAVLSLEITHQVVAEAREQLVKQVNLVLAALEA
jgi:hypothetical protein